MAQLSTLFGPEAVPLGTELGMTFGLIGGMGTEESMKKMISLQQQTNFMIDDYTIAQFKRLPVDQRLNIMRQETMETLDKLNSIENTSVATMEQMINVMNQFAAQAHLTGESIGSMAAMSAVLIEAGEEQNKGGRALRMIYARLGGDISGARGSLEQWVTVMDETTGTMRPLSEIIKDLGPHWDRMTGAAKQALAQQIGGNRHYVRFIKLMEGRVRMIELEENAINNLFPAMEERERRLEDNRFAIKLNNIELENQARILSENLLPALERQTSIRLGYHKVLTSLTDAEGNSFQRATASITRFGIEMAEHIRVMGGFLNIMTGVYSTIIAFEALGQVMKSMSMNLNEFYKMSGTGAGISAMFMSEAELKIVLKTEHARIRIYNLREREVRLGQTITTWKMKELEATNGQTAMQNNLSLIHI